MRFSLALATLPVALVAAVPTGKRCTGTISSLNDVAAAQKCTTININAFTVPAGKTFAISALDGTTVNMLGDVKFGVANWAGPLFSITGNNLSMETATLLTAKDLHTGMGKAETEIKMSGTYSNVKVLNSPAHVYSVSNPAKLVMSKLTIDNSAGDKPNSKSGGKAAGHNTDGFDVSTTDLTIEDSTVYNQDDCIAINKGSNIIFQRNTALNIQILNNKVVNNDQALRIKTKADASNASVTNVVFNGNTATGIKKYGVIVDQSYPSTLGTPGNKVAMSGISFGTNNIAVTSDAQRVAVDCGAGCTGSWDWSGLKVTGGKAGKVYNYKNIKAGSY
ncbi:polygalacturonase [Rhizoctonia solani]|uniref:endo-polygalacturonase n=1 Tax=Rhizoctonia solani TaxID=456999 RepID=A0A8H8P1Y6_9AGAM|nr:polygalacturonase [Rhizoctonia solani]QRW22837.1 polygalacturonase [Rhizoctonia solani]